MTDKYVRSTDGDNANDGSTWALAKIDLAGAAAVDAAGDTIFVSDAHDESGTVSVVLVFAGTAANPVRIICGDDAAPQGSPMEPPTSSATTGVCTLTVASNDWSIEGNIYVYGLKLVTGPSGLATMTLNYLPVTSGGNRQMYDSCYFEDVSSDAGANIILGTNCTLGAQTILKNCTVKYGASNVGIRGAGAVVIDGLTWVDANGTPANVEFFKTESSGRTQTIKVSRADLSAGRASAHMFSVSDGTKCFCIISNSRLPTSWTGSLFNGTPGVGQRFELHNCDDADTNYKLWIEDYQGEVVDETTIVRSGGASESRKMTTNANAKFPEYALRSMEIVRYNATTGSSVTVTLEFVHDSTTALQDDEFFIEVQYLGTSGFPLGSFISSAVSDILATPADTTDSSETWEMGSPSALTNPNTRKCTVTFTPQEAGYIHVVPVLAIASTTVYYDPEITVA